MSNSSQYASFPEFILGITFEIWEEKGINKIRRYYHDDVKVRAPDGIAVGNKSVIQATGETLAEFPDRVLLGEDVIWAQTGENSWYSSHRILSKATHRGQGKYGQPTNKEIIYRVIADCHAVKDDQYGWVINDEWLVQDQGAIFKQLGINYGNHKYLLDPIEGTDPLGLNIEGPYHGKGVETETSRLYVEHLNTMMRGEVSSVYKNYSRACQLELSEGKTVYGIDEAEQFWISFCASFPDSEFRIEHQIGQSGQNHPAKAAVRWRLTGDHSGYGMFGRPSGHFVDIMGISHAEYGPNGIIREFILIDHVSIWSQIHREDEGMYFGTNLPLDDE
ncbi:MAG: nuclear transport factor 2 family protein [Rhodobacteraceae bacterium]|nr:nuclear transport factor 2 family protein [Paracoccaceae bacterium]